MAKGQQNIVLDNWFRSDCLLFSVIGGLLHTICFYIISSFTDSNYSMYMKIISGIILVLVRFYAIKKLQINCGENRLYTILAIFGIIDFFSVFTLISVSLLGFWETIISYFVGYFFSFYMVLAYWVNGTLSIGKCFFRSVILMGINFIINLPLGTFTIIKQGAALQQTIINEVKDSLEKEQAKIQDNKITNKQDIKVKKH